MDDNYLIIDTINDFRKFTDGKKYKTIYADPPWQFANRTGKMAPEHNRLKRYSTMKLEDIKKLPVSEVADDKSHLYLWVPNALLPEGLEVLKSWGFEYKTNIIWEKIRKDGEPDGRGVGFYFRNVTEIVLFGVRGDKNRTLDPGRSQVNLLRSVKREHSRKPDEFVALIERCSPGPYLELFARGNRDGWDMWGNQATDDYEPTWSTYSNHTVSPHTLQPDELFGYKQGKTYTSSDFPGWNEQVPGQLAMALEKKEEYQSPAESATA